ncbi:hypothetical protein Ferp_2105 [Ferroglobus placidus DSM 10642]|uniref:Uncharacterized protein n=1 Tax=Ferroglobus placidus (strain DSM 10642 / AEDII12DO) TaxID=589924 RepID=D3S0H3_FERPA|nr:hypothetical protein [Ferroglobus placidus]ADC66236.1 hypothetical protein Ferp_2105 [Ferroglobus placidus DSM 10642]
MLLRVEVTKHALERLFERFPKHKKFDARTVANIFESIIKNGIVLRFGDEIRISTSNYTLCCVLEDKLVIKTVLKTKELGKDYKRLLRKGKRSEWNNVVFDMKKLERLCKRVEKLKELCKICGISKEQTAINRCKVYGFFVCSFCCISIGGGWEKCAGCEFDPIPR